MKWIDEILRPKACMILSFFTAIIDFSAVFEGNIWFNTLNASLFLAFVQNTNVVLHYVFSIHFIGVKTFIHKTIILDSRNRLYLFLAPCNYYIKWFMKLMDYCIHNASCDLFETLKTNILLFAHKCTTHSL